MVFSYNTDVQPFPRSKLGHKKLFYHIHSNPPFIYRPNRAIFDILIRKDIMKRILACIAAGSLTLIVSCETKELSKKKIMIEKQLIQRNIQDPRVIKAMEKVPRESFIPEKNRLDAYEDRPVSIGYGQTISQPYIVALMTETLQLKKGEKVLEIGTGSGYQAAILAELGAETYSIEMIPELAEFAKNNLNSAGYRNVTVKSGDGYEGWESAAPFDAIIVTCAPEKVPEPLMNQLKDGGRMVIPVGPENHVQELVLMRKENGKMSRQLIAPVRFVPMMGKIKENK